MISGVRIDGFKSLAKFDMELKPGLNVLVGPNGAGKTNIISFFQMLRDMQQYSISATIGKAGGVGAVFRKADRGGIYAEIAVEIFGSVRVGSRKILNYIYALKVGLGGKHDFVYYSKQSLLIKYRTVHSEPFLSIEEPDFSFNVSVDDVGKMSIRSSQNQKKMASSELISILNSKKSGAGNSSKEITEAYTMLAEPGESLLTNLQVLFRDVGSIRRDLMGGIAYNIVPASVRQQDDGAKEPGIASDGSGLYATLYYVKKKESVRNEEAQIWKAFRYSRARSDIEEVSFEEIVKFVKLANPSISSVEVENDPFDNKIQIKVDIKGRQNNVVIPLSSLSDGTVKWICLVTIILTSKLVFSLEEPENFLHPNMQTEIVNIIRSSIKEEDRFIILSTHSETILNVTEPEEVVIVSFEDGKTCAKRVDDPDKISQEISSTGFGLGYYYLAGALER